MSTLYIAEKPSQAKSYADVLKLQKKNGYFSNDNESIVVTYCFGHLVGLCKLKEYGFNPSTDELPFIPQEYKYSVDGDKFQQFSVIRSLVKKASTVVIATDADREGELIARLVLNQCNYDYSRPTKRLWISALDKASIEKGIANLKDAKEFDSLYLAGLTRTQMDWSIGMNFSKSATDQFSGGAGTWSIGRVQTATLRILVDRDNEIKNFKSKPFYTITAEFMQDDSKIKCQWKPSKGLDEEGRCIDENEASAVVKECSDKDGKIIAYETKEVKKQSPKPYNLAELQKEANKHGLSPAQTLEIAQSLYEKHKCTSYPRSESQQINDTQFTDAQGILNSLPQEYDEFIKLADVSKQRKDVFVKELSGGASHHALIPINNKFDIEILNKNEKLVYDLIVRRYIGLFLADHTYDQTDVVIKVNNEEFKTTGKVITANGWKELYKSSTKEDQDTLPALDKDKKIACSSISKNDKKTTPPPSFTGATLLSAMENCSKNVEDSGNKKILSKVNGIGTPATRAAILEILQSRGYMVAKDKELLPTEKGKELIAHLPAGLCNIESTADIENSLENIVNGDQTLPEVMDRVHEIVGIGVDDIKKAPKKEFKCPQCKMVLKFFNPADKNKKPFWYCSAYKSEENPCTYKATDNNSKPDKPIVPAKTSECPKCGNIIIRCKSKDGSYFWACFQSEDACGYKAKDKDGELGEEIVSAVTKDCPNPDCSEKITRCKSKKGDNYFWSCFQGKKACGWMAEDNNGEIGEKIEKKVSKKSPTKKKITKKKK